MKFSTPEQEAAIRDLMIASFNIEETRTLSADLGIRYEDLAGDTLTAKIRELCAYAQRQNTVEKLLNHCVRLRPNVNWWEVWNQSQTKPNLEQLTQSQPSTKADSEIYTTRREQKSLIKMGMFMGMAVTSIFIIVVLIIASKVGIQIPLPSFLAGQPSFQPIESGPVLIYNRSETEGHIRKGISSDPSKDNWSDITIASGSGLVTYTLDYTITKNSESSVAMYFNFYAKDKDVSGFRTLALRIDASFGLDGKTICLEDGRQKQNCLYLDQLGPIADKGEIKNEYITAQRKGNVYLIEMNLASDSQPIDLEQLRFIVITAFGGENRSGYQVMSVGNIGFSK